MTFGFGNHYSTTELFSFYNSMINSFLEIKNRLMLLTITILSLFLTGYYYKTFLLILVVISNTTLSNEILNYFIYTSLTEMFIIYIMLSFSLTIQIVYYVTFYHIICFLAPGLFKQEYIKLKKGFFVSVLLGLLSLYFFHNQLIPIVSSFFLSYQKYSIQTINFYFEAKIYEYLIFYKDLYISCFFVFQYSILLILLANFTSRNLVLLKTTRKFIYILLLTFSTLLTPPDVFSQLFLFFNLLIGFEMLIIINIFRVFLIR